MACRAVARPGYILVVDEADKAPTHVTAVLKTLVEDGEMLLTDGRRLVSAQIEGASAGRTERTIPIHPVRLKPPSLRQSGTAGTDALKSVARAGLHAQDFRMIVLANRPGFPFLGNDFYREIGDVFSGSVPEGPGSVRRHKLTGFGTAAISIQQACGRQPGLGL